MAVVILSGNSIGQIRRISVFTLASNTLTVDTAFASQISSGTKYNIVAQYVPSSTTSSGTYVHPNSTTETDVVEFLASIQDIQLKLDLNTLTKNVTIREYCAVDGTNYRLVSAKIYPYNFDSSVKAIDIVFNQPNVKYKVTMQSPTVEGSTRNIPYVYRVDQK